MSKPTILVADDEDANRRFVARVLGTDGWNVAEAADGAAALDYATRHIPDLVVMDIDMPRLDGWATTATIRAAAPPLSSVPILAYTTSRLDFAEILSRGMDGRLPKPCTAEDLLAAVAPWRPDGTMAGAERLAVAFGKEEMVGLIARFREQLAEALDALDGGPGQLSAHRIAGVAGTLGFSDVSASWLALSEADESVRDEARRDARIAIARIDREWGAA